MKSALIIGTCMLGLAACGIQADPEKTEKSDPPAAQSEPPAPVPETPVSETPSTADAFRASCLVLAEKEGLASPENTCTCAASNLSETMSDADFAIAAKAMTYANPTAAREALEGETDNLGGIISQLSMALEGCE